MSIVAKKLHALRVHGCLEITNLHLKVEETIFIRLLIGMKILCINYSVTTNELTRKSDVFDLYPEIIAKYPRFVDSVLERRRIQQLPVVAFSPREGWQQNLFTTLCTPPDPREVIWFYDHLGNQGKSYFARHYPSAYIITGGKHADIYYAYAFEKVVIFDWPRDHEQQFPYAVCEAFKNGYFLSTKYEVRTVRFEVPHVIIFANFAPDQSKLSHDRWNIITL